MGDQSLMVEEIEWLDQKINERIPDERFTLRGIGAFRGMEVIDYRTGETFRATGDEYRDLPPEFDLPVRSSSWFQWIMMGIGVLFILVAAGRLIYLHFIRTGTTQSTRNTEFLSNASKNWELLRN